MPKPDKEFPLFTTVTDETYAELTSLVGQRIAHVALWDDSLADELENVAKGTEVGDGDDVSAFDIDLYLEGGIYFELYGVMCFDELDSEPWQEWTQADARLASLVNTHTQLSDVAVDEEDGLILLLAAPGQKPIYLVIAAWLLAEWDELPDGEST